MNEWLKCCFERCGEEELVAIAIRLSNLGCFGFEIFSMGCWS